jgi:hypothetical protein
MRAKIGKERVSLSRWSRRKLEATAKPVAPSSTAPASAAPAAAAAPVELPPIDSLTFDSDFSVFLRPGVDGELKQAALKKLLRDPHFNVMDGLDTYIDDYTKADPIPPDVLADLLQRFGGPAEAEQAPVAAATGSTEKPVAQAPAVVADSGDGAAKPLAPAESGELPAPAASSMSASREPGSGPAQRQADEDGSLAGAGEQH